MLCCDAFIPSNVPVFLFFKNIPRFRFVSDGEKKMMMKHNFGSRKLSPSGYHRGGKGEKEKKKMDAFSKMLKIGKKSERLTGFQLPSWLPNSVGLPH